MFADCLSTHKPTNQSTMPLIPVLTNANDVRRLKAARKKTQQRRMDSFFTVIKKKVRAILLQGRCTRSSPACLSHSLFDCASTNRSKAGRIYESRLEAERNEGRRRRGQKRFLFKEKEMRFLLSHTRSVATLWELHPHWLSTAFYRQFFDL